VGKPIEKFYPSEGDFRTAWNRFLDRTHEHGETQISRGDGETIFVEYTVKADFLPGPRLSPRPFFLLAATPTKDNEFCPSRGRRSSIRLRTRAAFPSTH
jgi:hypothetical protein